jgi:hypothetical protein
MLLVEGSTDQLRRTKVESFLSQPNGSECWFSPRAAPMSDW